MRLVFDIQSLQSASRLRGIGRDTHSLISALIAEHQEHEIILLANGALADDHPRLVADFEALYPGTQCVVCSLPGPSSANDPENGLREAVSELMREAFVAELEPDLVHIFSALEGFEESVITSIGKLEARYPVTATFYDLIPLLNPDQYLKTNAAFKAHYTKQLDSLRRADGLLAISQFSGAEAVEHLAYPEAKVAVASLGPLSVIEAMADDQGGTLAALASQKLSPGFLLYVGGSDARKNLPRLIEAWCALSPTLQAAHPLVLAGSMPSRDVETLLHIAKKRSAQQDGVRFLGQVTDDELAHLYKGCKAFVFPSWHEGFGLPALEAMAAGAAVIAANTSSLPEVVGEDEALFDPFNVEDISAKLEQVLTDQAFAQKLRVHGSVQAAKFSWRHTADQALAFFEQTVAAYSQRTVERNEPPPGEYWQAQYPERLHRLLKHIAEALRAEANVKRRTRVMSQVAAAIDRNEQALLRLRFQNGSAISPWLIEGPFDSSYSLALLNREFALALRNANIEVQLRSSEGPGDFDPEPAFLDRNPDVAAMMLVADKVTSPAAVTSRLMYPPRVHDLPPGFGMLHLWGWEEGELPSEWVGNFNTYVDGMTTMSRYVSKVLVDNGVTVPQAVAGVGVDHWERISGDASFELPCEATGFIFLHVSSCFPRKGIDVLLSAWGEAFTSRDDVTLLIKTFPNPHNAVRQLLAEACQDSAHYPNVVIIEEDLTDGELKALMEMSRALVAPSRGEGFGLPIGEAMLSGVPVIATGYGGHMDFCDAENAWLVDYEFARAQTHFGLADSVWAEPCEADLARQLRALYDATRAEHQLRAGRGRERLLSHFTWARVAGRVMAATCEWKSTHAAASSNDRIGWVSSWNTRCGIAAYSAYLIEHFEGEVQVYASRRTREEELDKLLLPSDGEEVARCWSSGFGDDLGQLRDALFADLPGSLVIQFNYGFFEFPALSDLLLALKEAGVVVVVMFHSTCDPPELPKRRLELLSRALSECDRLLVHSPQDLNRLKAIGLTDNTMLLPHGVLDFAGARRADAANQTIGNLSPPFRIASFGFLLPNKGLEQLLEAVKILRAGGHDVVLHMLNAEYPAQASRDVIVAIDAKIQELELESVVTLDTIYYTDEECLQKLAKEELVVFPYQETKESSSAAVRHAIASGTPVAVTPLAIFEDVTPAVIRLGGVTPEAIAKGISDVSAWGPEERGDHAERADKWRATHRHNVIAKRLEGLLSALKSANR